MCKKELLGSAGRGLLFPGGFSNVMLQPHNSSHTHHVSFGRSWDRFGLSGHFVTIVTNSKYPKCIPLGILLGTQMAPGWFLSTLINSKDPKYTPSGTPLGTKMVCEYTHKLKNTHSNTPGHPFGFPFVVIFWSESHVHAPSGSLL